MFQAERGRKVSQLSKEQRLGQSGEEDRGPGRSE